MTLLATLFTWHQYFSWSELTRKPFDLSGFGT